MFKMLNRNSSFFHIIKKKLVPLLGGLFLVLVFIVINLLSVKKIDVLVNTLENLIYDFQVKVLYKPLEPNSTIAIVDIDDKSLSEKGRWPWTRNLLADLVNKLFDQGATIVATDITFPDKSQNIVNEVIEEIAKRPKKQEELLVSLKDVEKTFDYDAQLAESLKKGNSVLSVVFSDQGENVGVLPEPLIKLTPEMVEKLDIEEESHYLSNIKILQDAAKNGGFINTKPDNDGVLRFTPLILRHGNDVYASLALQAVKEYLLATKVELKIEQYGDSEVLEGITLDNLEIPTNPKGEILIPFRGGPYSFPYISAADVLDGKVPKSSFEGKMIFIGISAEALGDVVPTSVAPVYPGVEVHATVASGILDNYLPYKPRWGNGVVFLVMAIFGLIFAILFPFLGAIANGLITFVFLATLIFTKQWFWVHHGIVFSVLLPIALSLLLYSFNTIWGYLSESKRGQELKSMFGQYVPPAYLEEMIKKGGEINLEGESKELSVLFSDIRSFTSLSEKMTATELKHFLNRFFNPITETIFNNKGTIDKYVGDMVMAFWGAPLGDDRHAFHAVSTALDMQAKLQELNKSFIQENKPPIKIGIGINTGVMNVGDMGSKYRRSYTVLGDAVNLASRLEGQSKYYYVDIIVGTLTWQETRDDFIYRKLDKIKVKGKYTAEDIYKPCCRKDQLTEELAAELKSHHEGLDYYFHQKWDDAIAIFTGLKAQYPNNEGLYSVYIKRIDQLKMNPPGQDWDGSFTSLEK